MPTITAELTQAIGKADATVLRNVLISMCEASAECNEKATDRLLIPVARKRKADEAIQEPANTKKFKNDEPAVSRYEKCGTCKAVYDVTENRRDSCQTHTGSLDIDPDFFPDDDDIQYGDGADYIDWEKDWRFGECPEGFTWTCCDQRGDEEPCVVSRHVATESGHSVLYHHSKGLDSAPRSLRRHK